MTPRLVTEIPHEEMHVLGTTVNSMGLNEAAGDALHLRVFTGGRQWIVETAVGQLVVDIEDESSKPSEDRLLHLSERICQFADCFGDDTVSLLTGNEGALIAYASGANAAIDLVPWSGPELTPWTFVPTAAAVVPMRRFQMLLWSARCVPAGVEAETYPMPPIWLQLGDGTIGLHVDWSDFLPSKATYRLRTISHHGRDTVAIPHRLIESVLRPGPDGSRDEEETGFSVTIGTVPREEGDRKAMMLAVDGWRLILWLTEPMQERWAARVNEVLAADDIEVAATDGIEWLIAGGFDVRVKLHHGHPDVAHVRAVLLRDVEESVELFRELGQLNAASNHIRYWLNDGAVRSAVDVQCTELHRLPDIVRQVGAAAAKYAPMLAVFGSTA